MKMKTLRKAGLLLLGGIGSATLLFSCGGNSNGGETDPAMNYTTPVQGDWVISHELSDPEGLNPIITNDASSATIDRFIYEALLELDYATAELTPVLAESRPEISDDHLTYKFTLKKNITFSDGHPLTAKDVVFSFKVVKNPLIINAAALRNYHMDIKDVQATDDYTVTITMLKPYFLAEYFLGGLSILPKHILDPKNLTDSYTIAETNNPETAARNEAMSTFAKWFESPEKNREKQYLVGTGPYVFEEWRTSENIRLKRFDGYWDKGNNKYKTSYPNQIVFKVVNDRPAAVTALKNGDLDFMEYIPPALFTDIDTTTSQNITTTSYLVPTYMYIGWNQRRAVFGDKKTRQALSYLVDKTMLIKNVVRGFAIPTNSPIYFGRPEYDSTLNSYAYNPEKAKQLLAEAGWKDSNGDGILDRMENGKRLDFSFTFLLNAGNEMRENIALLLIEEFRKVGIQAQAQKIEWSVFLENLKSNKFEAYIGAWVNDPTPSDLYQIWHSTQIDNKGSNYAAFNNPRADKLIEDIRTEFDEAKRMAYYKELQQIIGDEQPYTFLWVLKYPTAYNKRLQGVEFYTVRPGYVLNNWWAPTPMQKYTNVQ